MAPAAAPSSTIIRDIIYTWIYVTITNYTTINTGFHAPSEAALQAQLVTNLLADLVGHIDPANALTLHPKVANWVANIRGANNGAFSAVAPFLQDDTLWTGPNHPTMQDLDGSFR